MTGTVLLISPDYASHYYPMSALAEVLRSRGHRVVVATGPGLREQVRDDGNEHSDLILGPGSNPGVLRLEDQSQEERLQMDAFFDSTRLGMVPALLHQAHSRRRDLLYEPLRVADDIHETISRVEPDSVVVDQLAYSATAAMRGMSIPYVSFHPGHPSAITTDLPYGFPARIPVRIRFEESEMERLLDICQLVSRSFTDAYNAAVAAIDASIEPLTDAFGAVSPGGTLVNYPSALGIGYGLPTSVRFIGSAVRRTRLPEDLSRVLDEPRSRPRIYVSLGSFFSARTDLLQKIVTAFRREPVELVVAAGSTPRSELGDLPNHWTVAESLPQPSVIERSSLVITHGGVNTVTESLAAGVPILAGPLSTDQFAVAADIEDAGLGRAFDPNHDGADTIADLAHEVMSRYSAGAAALGRALRANPGQVVAADLVEQSMKSTSLS